MYKDPFNDEPISDEERHLKYEFDEGHDYFADVDKLYPAWTPPVVTYMDTHPTSAAFSDERLREVAQRATVPVLNRDDTPKLTKDGKPEVKSAIIRKTLPNQRYVRAIDPAGNLCPIITSTCRPDRDKAHGDDGLPTQDAMVAKKSRRGWLIVERNQSMWNPFSQRNGQDYCAWALAVMKYRKQQHAEDQEREGRAWYEEKRRQALEIAKESAQVQGDVIAKAIREATQPAPPAKAAK